ncbi:MAG: Fic family protein [Methylococcales bacterium]|nr:Fic family protein [Methylococcales bacterium]
MNWDPQQPYQQLPALPPQQDIESKTILRQCITARSALAELNQAAKIIPNQAILINTLPLLEAKSSSEIENIVTTMDKLFQFADDGNVADSATKEALRYRTALYEGYKALEDRPLSTNTAVAICSQIKGTEMQIRRVSGTALVNAQTKDVIYTPPEGEDLLREKLANWESFIHGEADLEPLVRLAVAHYQFEAIHPFTDGNGRTGRIINTLFLIQEGLLSLPILYLSRYIIQNKQDYYRLLLEVTEYQNWEGWILFILKGIEETAQWTNAKIDSLVQLENHTRDYVQEKLPKIYTRELIEVLFEQPYCRIGNLVAKNVVKRQTASVYLKQLCEISVLVEQEVGREKIFVHPKLMKILTQDSNEFDLY